MFFPDIENNHGKSATVATLNFDIDFVAENHPAVFGDLTSRQHDIVDMLVQGKNNKEIAKALCISSNTVKTHIYKIFRILGVSSRAQAVAVVNQALIVPELEAPQVFAM